MTFFFIDVALVAVLISGFNLFFNNNSFMYKLEDQRQLPPRYEDIENIEDIEDIEDDEPPPQYNNINSNNSNNNTNNN